VHKGALILWGDNKSARGEEHNNGGNEQTTNQNSFVKRMLGKKPSGVI